MNILQTNGGAYQEKRRHLRGRSCWETIPGEEELKMLKLNSCLKLSFVEGDRGVHHPGSSSLKPPPDGPGKVIKACDSGENNQSLVSNHVFSGSQRTRRTSV